MNKRVPFLLFPFLILLSCKKSTDIPTSSNPPPAVNPPVDTPVVVQPAYSINEYDAVYTSNSGSFYTYSYHVKDTLYYGAGQNYGWASIINNGRNVLYYASGQTNAALGTNKGCVALVSNRDSSQQNNSNQYTGSYYKFSLFNDTTVGNVQFMIPTDHFPSVDSIPVGVAFLNFTGGLHSFYSGMAKAEVKVTPDQDFVQLGDSTSYANPLVPAKGQIDSVEVHLLVTRFSDNGIHPNSNITKTMDGNYLLTFYFHNGSYFSLINAKFTNLFFQKASM